MARSTARLCAALAATALLLVGCSGDNDGTPESAADGSGSAGASQDSGGGVQERDAPAIVEQSVVADPGFPEDAVTIGIQSLSVDGPTMVLRLVVTPDFASVSDDEEVALADVWSRAEKFGVPFRLIDRDNLKEYSVIADVNGDRWASGSYDVETVNGEPMYAFAVFAAPEDDIETVDVRLNEQWPDFTDVPITR